MAVQCIVGKKLLAQNYYRIIVIFLNPFCWCVLAFYVRFWREQDAWHRWAKTYGCFQHTLYDNV